ncbi:MAG TPA: hypothetical protein VK992_05150 [Candidatus Caenarcaniphilales bacterium]|nr:hypothetical protein [Candidatus Caenarcaniphilales bacterium]
MIETRPVTADEIELLAGTGTQDGRAFAAQLREMLDEGTTRLDWCFLAMSDGEPVARVCFAADERAAGDTPPSEMYLFGLALDWQSDAAREAARALLDHALPLVAVVGPPIDARVNPEVHADADERRALYEVTGFGLFQEKEGYFWQAGERPAPRSSRLRFRSLSEVGRDEFIAALARGPATRSIATTGTSMR